MKRMPNSFFFDQSEIVGRRRRSSVAKSVGGCEECRLYLSCNSPRMNPYGNGDIVIVGMQPGKQEDREGRPFYKHAPSGRRLRKMIEPFDLDNDFILTNAIQCYGDNTRARVLCHQRLDSQLKEIKPELIFCLGGDAASSVLGRDLTISKVRGLPVVSKIYNCWVMCSYHPAYLEREEDDDLERIWKRDFARGINLLGNPIHVLDEDRNNHWITDEDEAISLIESLDSKTAFDYETNQLSVFEGEPKILLIGLATSEDKGYSISDPMAPALHQAFANFLISDVPKTAHNSQFETLWSRRIFGVVPKNLDCTMLNAHLLDERRGNKSLDWLTFINFGTNYKKVFGKPTNMVPDARSAAYNACDARYGWALDRWQGQMLKSSLRRSHALYKQSAPMLADMTWHGIKVDANRLELLKKRAQKEIRAAESSILLLPAIKKTEIKTRRMFTLSNKDLTSLFYDVLGLRAKTLTKKTKEPSLALDALEEVATDEAMDYIKCLRVRGEWHKMLTTYIEPYLAKRDENDLLHSDFLLHVARSFRSSSKNPNVQNVMNHSEHSGELRRCLIPKLDLFLDPDYSGMEVRIIASVSGDKNLLSDLEQGVDLHRLWASRIFNISEKDVTDDQRFRGKNEFVFPNFYGASWKRTIMSLGLSERRARDLYLMFWARYQDAKAWQAKMVTDYQKTGYIELASGFRRHGPLDILQIGNTPVQGAAFHILLENAIELWKEMKRRNMRSHLISETHDSLVIDTDADECEEIVVMGNEILHRLPEWLPTPVELKVDWEIGSDWGSMEKL